VCSSLRKIFDVFLPCLSFCIFTKFLGQIGAGDQGIMFGFACNETPVFMPLSHHLAFQAIRYLEKDIAKGREGDQWLSPFLPDSKSQVTVLYDDGGKPERIDTLVISTCHRSDVSLADLEFYVQERVLNHLTKPQLGLFRKTTKFLINPAGEWTFGGPAADSGLTGRKIVVDNYGADCPIGGGAFSGKDPTKVDRSGSYIARYIAKNIVAAGLAEKVVVQLAYVIGVIDPVSIRINTFGTHDKTWMRASPQILAEEKLVQMVRELVNLTPSGIINKFDLRRPIYQATASGGHFGREEFPWESIDLAEKFSEYAKG